MSNIQLKKIITNNDGLIIRDGKVTITNTTPSLNFYSGSIVTNGGISIQCTENATNSKIGGGLSVAGGVAVLKDAYIGGNLEIDSNAGVLKIAGITTHRLFLDTITNKNFHISLDGIHKQFELQQDTVRIDTKQTLIWGNVNLESTDEITLSISGGSRIDKNLHVGENILMGGDIIFSEKVSIEADKGDDILSVNGRGIMISSDTLSCLSNSISLNNIISITDDNVSITGTTEFEKDILLKQNIFIKGALTVDNKIETGNDLYIRGNILKIPVGQLEGRYGVEGCIRFNNETQQFEGYTGKIWQTFGGVIDTDYDTTIIAEKYQGADDDSLRFITNKEERMIISSVGNVGIGTEFPMSKLVIHNKAPTAETTGHVCISTDTHSTFMGIQKTGGFYISSQEQIRLQVNGKDNVQIRDDGVWIDSAVYANNKIYINTSEIHTKEDELRVKQNKVSFYTDTDTESYFLLDGNTKQHLLAGNLTIHGEMEVSQIRLTSVDFLLAPLVSNSGICFRYKQDDVLSFNVLDNTLKITMENTEIAGNVDIAKAVNVQENLKVDGYVEINGQLKNNGDTYCEKDVFVKGQLQTNSLQTTGDITANGNVFIKGGLQSETGESFMDKLKINEFNVNDNFLVNEQLNINLTSHFKQPVLFSQYLEINHIHLGKDFTIQKKENENMECKLNGESVLEIEHTSGNVKIKHDLTVDNLDVKSDVRVSDDVSIMGNLKIYSTTPSSSINEGSLVVNGGMGVGENLNVGGDMVVNGTLTVVGEMTTIDSKNISINDNTFFLNSAPSGSSDAGIFITRYQKENDTGAGDVVNDNDYITFALNRLEQTGLSLDEIKLPETASELDNYYISYWVRCISGFSANQVRQITSYNGKTKIAKLSQPWTGQNPTDLVNLYKKSHVGLLYNEIDDTFELVGVHQQSTSDYSSHIGLKCDSIVTKKSTYVVSDPKLQEKCEQIEENDILSRIMKIRSVKYTNKGDKKQQLGIVPEELEQVFPELVEAGQYKSIDYARLSVVLLESIKQIVRILRE
jgi:predicted acyltransferase (DUF342 family)